MYPTRAGTCYEVSWQFLAHSLCWHQWEPFSSCKNLIFDWMVHLFTSQEVGMKYIHLELSNLIGQFEHTIVHLLMAFSQFSIVHP